MLDAEAFKSHQALGKRRPPSLPWADPDPWDGCSLYVRRQQAVRMARRRPRLGTFIAELLIPDDAPIVRELPDRTGHFNIWGDADTICGWVVDVTPV
jgi:hypothetical protein